jgi:hypothetical protein
MIIPVIAAAVTFVVGTALGVALMAGCYGVRDAREELLLDSCASYSQKSRRERAGSF